MELKGLKEIRKNKKLCQLKVAMDLSISREVISYYENGEIKSDGTKEEILPEILSQATCSALADKTGGKE